MSTKREGDSCYQKAAEDEPIFVLRAQDLLAPACVRTWAQLARSHGTPEAKVREAFDLADRMVAWQDATNRCKVPD